jgi:sialic acid synthase SpsE
MQTLARRFGVPVGFSDHTPDATFSGLAVAAGADILEKHITLDPEAAGPDHFFSLHPEQFAEYVTLARHARATLGDGEICAAPEEDEVRRLARGSLVTTASIKAGETVEANRLDVQRPADGIAPTRWDDVVGRVARTDIPANTRLSWSMLR